MVYYARGEKFRPWKNTTLLRLYDKGYRIIVFKNGDFTDII